MNTEVKIYIEKYNMDIQKLFIELRNLVYHSVSSNIDEKPWAKLPSYYMEDRFIRIIPFKDHINIEAAAIMEHRAELEGFKITPKGMLQIHLKQCLPTDVLQSIFKKTLLG